MEPSTNLDDQAMRKLNKTDEDAPKRAIDGNNNNNNNEICKEDNGNVYDDHERETSSTNHLKFDIEDFNETLLGNADYPIYNECSVPFYHANNKNSLFTRGKQLTSSLTNSNSAKSHLKTGNDCEFTMIDLSNRNSNNEFEEAEFDEDGSEESGFAQTKIANSNKTSVHGDMIQSINNLRLNVNNHIIGGSKNVMGKMRKLSIGELSRHGKPTGHKYKIAFYTTLISLSLLFLYLIYQNLFNDSQTTNSS